MVGVGTVDELIADLGLSALAGGAPPLAEKSGEISRPRRLGKFRRPARRAVGLAAVAVLLFVLTGVVFTKLDRFAGTTSLGALDKALERAAAGTAVEKLEARLFETYLDASRPAGGSLTIDLLERRSPAASTCAAVAMGVAKADMRPLAQPAPDRFEASIADGVCGLELQVRGGANVHLMAFGLYVSGGRQIGEGPPDGRLRAGPRQGRLAMRIDPPRRARRPLRYRHAVLAATRPLDGAEAWWAKNVSEPGVAPGTAAWQAAVERLNRRGVTVRTVRHEIRR